MGIMGRATLFIYSLIFCLFTWAPLSAQVEAPNYDFSLDSLSVFYPGQNLQSMVQEHGEGELLEKAAKTRLFKFYVAHIRYKFPVFVQVDRDGQALDFFARLPTYFLHDIFHQSLINRYGNQQEYFRQENNAVYKWTELDSMQLTYSGTCTITCFPIYLTGVGQNLAQTHESLIDKMKL